ncbi:sigma-70 family RNA polymerase sigma factor [soil metagenome]
MDTAASTQCLLCRSDRFRAFSLLLPPVDTLSDAQLIECILNGDRDLYSVIVGRYQEMLYRFAFGMVQDSDTAADLVQDSFVKAYTSLSRCRDRHRFSAWIFRIVRNRCTDYLRGPSRKQVGLEVDSPYLSAQGGPEDDFQRDEVRIAVDRALAALPDAQREAFLLKHVEDLSYEEMADLVGVGVSALKMRVMRAREALQNALRDVEFSGSVSM